MKVMPRSTVCWPRWSEFRPHLAVLLLLLASCQEQEQTAQPPADTGASATTCPPEAVAVATQLGQRMRTVSLLAPDSVRRAELSSAYNDLVAPSLLERWQSESEIAPGRTVSNPWPLRIAVAGTSAESNGCTITGDVVYVTSADTANIVERRRVSLTLRADDGWRVHEWSWVITGPADVVQRYYDAIAARDFETAYRMWADSGRASGQSFDEFRAGFAQTAAVRAETGDSISVQGAAGTHYATVPVEVHAELRDGTRQRFTGTYTLRRSLVDGATAEQRRWRIHSAEMREN